MKLVVSDLSEIANVVGRNGTFSIKELQICHFDKGDVVFYDFVSRKTGKMLNAGFWVGVKDMDRIARDWLQHRSCQ